MLAGDGEAFGQPRKVRAFFKAGSDVGRLNEVKEGKKGQEAEHRGCGMLMSEKKRKIQRWDEDLKICSAGSMLGFRWELGSLWMGKRCVMQRRLTNAQ